MYKKLSLRFVVLFWRFHCIIYNSMGHKIRLFRFFRESIHLRGFTAFLFFLKGLTVTCVCGGATGSLLACRTLNKWCSKRLATRTELSKRRKYQNNRIQYVSGIPYLHTNSYLLNFELTAMRASLGIISAMTIGTTNSPSKKNQQLN